MLKIDVEYAELERLQQATTNLRDGFRGRAMVRVKAVSFEVERRVKTQMPIDTGRARGSWGHATHPAVEAGDSVWEEAPDGLSITQGTTVAYVPRLNEGHSQQAPAGFLDAIFEECKEMLVDGLLDEVEDLL